VNAEFVSAPMHCGLHKEKTTCEIPMRVLEMNPYNYRTSDKIEARVAAVNEYGAGPFSKPKTAEPARRNRRFKPLQNVILKHLRESTYELQWPLEESPDDQKFFDAYKIMWNEGYSVSEVDTELAVLGPQISSFHFNLVQ